MDEQERIIEFAVNLSDAALLASAKGEAHSFSDGYQEKMALLFRHTPQRRRRSMSRLRKGIVAAAVITAILIGSVTAGAFWKEISDFFQALYTQYADLSATRISGPPGFTLDESLNGWTDFWYPNYLPEGYSFYEAEELSRIKSITFKAGEGQFIDFKQMPAGTIASNDTEGTPISGIFIGDSEAFALEKDMEGIPYRTLIWHDDVTSFKLTGNETFEELTSIAEELMFIDNTGG